ncbi:MAG TPA: ATP-binding protein [Bacillus sp. (in: firmicutes)]|nr:ATP-binding protein [Bacillus sp. (in: firmicutes)]
MLELIENFKNINDIHNWLNKCADAERNSIPQLSIDMGHLKWLSPIGITVLLSTLNYLDRYFSLDTIAPQYKANDKFDLVGYMERMNFLKLCPRDVRASFESSTDMDFYYTRSRNRKEKELDELRVSHNDMDIVDLDKSVKRIMKDKGLHINRISDIANIVTELGQNAIEHANTECYSCVQYYKKTTKQPERVEIAICDTGSGIFNSLKNYVEYTTFDDVVKQAIFTTASSLPNQERGKGLLGVKKTAFGWSSNAEFYVRTHDSSYRIHNDRLELLNRGEYFPGTYFHLIINI